MCFIVSLSSSRIVHLLSSPFFQYLFSLSSFPHLHFVIIFLSLSRSLSPGTLEFLLVTYLSYSLCYLDSLILSLRSCLSESLSLSFIHIPSALNCVPVSLVVFLSLLLRVLLLLSIAFRQYPALFPSAHFVLKLCRSLPHFHSQPAHLALFPHFTMYPGVSLSIPSTRLRYFSCTLSTSSCSIHPQISAPYISTLSTMLSDIIILPTFSLLFPKHIQLPRSLSSAFL
jgi:hypothetical protein